MGAKIGQEGRKMSHKRRKMSQDRCQDGPGQAQDGAKMAPRWVPKASQDGAKTVRFRIRFSFTDWLLGVSTDGRLNG